MNEHNNWALHLELPTGVSDPTIAFWDAHGPKIQNLSTPP